MRLSGDFLSDFFSPLGVDSKPATSQPDKTKAQTPLLFHVIHLRLERTYNNV